MFGWAPEGDGATLSAPNASLLARLLDGRVRIAVTTEMGARGLDIPGLTHVINLELPTDPQHYVHRAGRCGRAGKDAMWTDACRVGKRMSADR